MMSTSDWEHPGAEHDARFRSTRWSLVLAAGDQSRAEASAALAALCEAYWLPVYVYVRRHVADMNEAQDLTQEFFVRLLEKNYLADVVPARGRFRTFLLTAVQRFLAKERDKAHARKRGGGRVKLSLDFAWDECHSRWEPCDPATPEQAFDRQWALRLLEIVQQRLRAEYVRKGNERLFDHLAPLMARTDSAAPCASVAELLGMTVGAVKTAVYRLRRRYRDLLRAEILQTVADAAEVDDEVRRLFDALD